MNLKPLLDEISKRGLMGIAIVKQGHGRTPYLAKCLGRDGRVCDPTTWDTYDTPEAAVNELCDKLRVERIEKEQSK